MKCFLTVLRSIGILVTGVAAIGIASAVLGAAAVCTGYLFGLSEPASFAIFVVYFIITLGTLLRIIECTA